VTYHHKGSLGQTSTPDMVFSLTDPDVAAGQGLTVPASTTTPATPGKTPTVSVSGGGKGTSASSYPSGTSPSPSLITNAAYSSTPTDSTPHWLPWALGGGVAVIGLALIFAARR